MKRLMDLLRTEIEEDMDLNEFTLLRLEKIALEKELGIKGSSSFPGWTDYSNLDNWDFE